MSWFGQIRHVFGKDLQAARWLLVAYAVGVLIATVVALSASGSELVAWLFLLTGLISVATVVQADSPTASNAFWASRPFFPEAMLGAKLLFVLLILIPLPFLGQLVGLLLYDVSAREIVRQLGRSWTDAGFALIPILVAAALTRDLRSFLLACVVSPGLLVVLLYGLDEVGVRGSDFAQIPPLAEATLVVVGAFLLLGTLLIVYRTRDVRPWTWAVAFAGMALLFVHVVVPQRRHLLEAPASVQRASLEFAIADPRLLERSDLQLSVRYATPIIGHRLQMTSAQVTVQLRDGSTITLPVSGLNEMRTFSHPTISGIDWIGVDPPPLRSHTIYASVTVPQRNAIRRGIATAAIEGWMEVLEPRITASLPLRNGARLEQPGRRLRLEHWTDSPDERTIRIGSEEIHRKERGDRSARYVLVNHDRGQAMPLRYTHGNWSSKWLVLPGSTLVRSRSEYETPSVDLYPDAARDTEWFRSATLGVVNWVARGRYQFRAAVSPTPWGDGERAADSVTEARQVRLRQVERE